MALEVKEIAIIGAGIVGLSTALSIQETFPLANITLFADKFNDETLSSGAGGIFRPDINIHHDPELLMKWLKESFSFFLKLVKSEDASGSGTQLVSGYHLSSSPIPLENKVLQSLVPEYRHLNAKEMEIFPEKFKSGLFYTTVIIDCRYYLPWMKSKFEKAGGKVVKKHLSSLDEIPRNYNIIINCSGLGASQLLHDDMLVPIRGQTIKVKAPWIKNFYYGDEVYICPGVDYVTLGGVRDYGSRNTNVNTYQKQFIWDKSKELIPSLKNAEVLWDWVGLRPHRPSVRVDAAFVNCNGIHKMVINNYGHGGHGVSLSWGTAQEVVRILQKIIMKKTFTLAKL